MIESILKEIETLKKRITLFGLDKVFQPKSYQINGLLSNYQTDLEHMLKEKLLEDYKKDVQK